MRYRAVVFDWDGTLIDSEAKIVNTMLAVAAELELAEPTAASVRNIIGLGLPEAVAVLFRGQSESQRCRIVERYRHHFHQQAQIVTALFPGVRATLGTLKSSGYLLAVATGKSRRGLDRDLTEQGVGTLFDATRCAGESRSKPDPTMLHELMSELEVRPEETVMVGDTEYDLVMARRAGVDAVAVSYGAHERHRLKALTPKVCLDSIGGLPAWLAVGGDAAQKRRVRS